ncbi:MAG: BlaI/MecI/CopY family transcriptional regulator [Clostridia bacterium]|nr:BlaI/MecI/CopY family transcriptional regulator [Clostridia bacterium]
MIRMERLPDAELEVMRAVWSLPSPCATGDVRRELEKSRPWNLSALQTLLTRLTGRGFVATDKEGRQRTYQPLISEEDYLAFENAPFLTGRRGATVSRLVASLYKQNSIDRDDLEELRAFIDRMVKKEGR